MNDSFPDVTQHVVGDFDRQMDTNHIMFQDDWQLFSSGELFEIRSHEAQAADADSVNGTLLPRLSLDKQGNIVVRNTGNNVSIGVKGASILGGGTDTANSTESAAFTQSTLPRVSERARDSPSKKLKDLVSE